MSSYIGTARSSKKRSAGVPLGGALTRSWGCVLLILLLTAFASRPSLAQDKTIYVDNSVAPGGDRTSWESAYKYLQDAVCAQTTLRYELAESGSVSITVYNALGQRVTTIVEGDRVAGRHEVTWLPRGLASGLYPVRFEHDGNVATRHMLDTRHREGRENE